MESALSFREMFSATVILGAFFSLVILAIIGFFVSPRGTLRQFLRWPFAWPLNGPLPKEMILVSLQAISGYLGIALIQSVLSEYFAGSDHQWYLRFIEQKPWTAFLMIGFLGPIAEELVARGYFLETFRRFGSRKTGILLSSLFFGLAHSPHWIAAALLGLYLCQLRFECRSLVPPFIVHAFLNFSLLILSFSSRLAAPQDMLPEHASVTSGDLVFAIALGGLLTTLGWPAYRRIFEEVFAPDRARPPSVLQPAH
jgi:membrane protease YdiL (CAAX protease family)